ncbi:cystatin-A isoform X1 [Enhydra lutris kenyoni]|uniref:Cystatin-A isoform X1 n=1 Tax=Enhydra lutris kenyoni TaxID=391180 RepID=A0A2Y9KHH2_ENHLU|nr:cystatin-A isoform X1 [Enhydra lutris kenyoni]
MIPGGLTEAKPATPEIQEIANERVFLVECQLKEELHLGKKGRRGRPSHREVKPQLEEKANETYEEFEAVEYKTQVVAGINYYIKVRVGGNSYIHMKVFKGLPQQNSTLTLTAYQTDKSKDDEITGF